MEFINKHLNKENDGINITLFNKDQKYLEFYLTSNKNKKFELELYDYYGPAKLKFETISLFKEKFFKNPQIIEELNKYSFTSLSTFFEKINEIYKS